MSLRYVLVLISLCSLGRFLAAFTLPRSAGGGRIAFADWQPTQKAMLLLMAANLMNNNPLFALWALSGAWYMQMVEQLEQSLFIHALVLWLLVVFDALARIHRHSRREPALFWLGKLLL